MRQKLFRLSLQILGGLILLGVTLFVLLRWSRLPDQIPLHFDGRGLPEGYEGKSGLIGLIVTAWIMYGLFTALSYFPMTWNLPAKSPRAYRAAGNMMPMLGLVLALVFGWMTLCAALSRPLGVWFLPATLAGVTLPLVYLIIESVRK